MKAERTDLGNPRHRDLGDGEPRAAEEDNVPLANGHGRDPRPEKPSSNGTFPCCPPRPVGSRRSVSFSLAGNGQADARPGGGKGPHCVPRGLPGVLGHRGSEERTDTKAAGPGRGRATSTLPSPPFPGSLSKTLKKMKVAERLRVNRLVPLRAFARRGDRLPRFQNIPPPLPPPARHPDPLPGCACAWTVPYAEPHATGPRGASTPRRAPRVQVGPRGDALGARPATRPPGAGPCASTPRGRRSAVSPFWPPRSRCPQGPPVSRRLDSE